MHLHSCPSDVLEIVVTMRSSRIHVYLICLVVAFVSEVLIISELDLLQPTPDFLRSRNLEEVQQRLQDINHETPPPMPAVVNIMPFIMDDSREHKPEKKKVVPDARPFGVPGQVDDSESASQLRPLDPFRPVRRHEVKHDAASRHSIFKSLLLEKNTSRATFMGPKRPRKTHPAPVMVDLPPTNQSVLDDRIIYYLHIHKSAGSTICRAAEFNGLYVSETNCNVQVDQRCCGQDDSLEAQRDFAKSTKFNFVANEKDMYSTMDTEHYRYVVMLRDSRERYNSHWKHVYRRYNDDDTVENFTEWWTGQPDNWNVRKICGTPCMNTPKYGLTEQLWNQTLERLSLFEDVLFVDRFNESFTKFASRVGWTHMPVHQPLARHVDYPSTTDEFDPMMTALDDALYEFAEGMYRGIPQPYTTLSTERRTALRDYFTRASERKCNTPCCAATCSTY
jgi:hypothetical protein